MFQNNVKIAFRNLWRNKTFSFINLFGLTTGTACCLYILLYVQDHRSYDQHHSEAGNLYRIISDLQLPNDQAEMHMATCSPPIPMGMKSDFPEVEQAARACRPMGVEQSLLRVGEQVFFEKPGYYVDSNFFQILEYQFVAGDPAHALDEPFSVVISEDLSQKLFKTNDPIGQTIGIGGGGDEQKFKVTGVFNSSLGKSHLHSEFFMTMNSGGIGEFIRTNDSWAGNNFVYSYLRLKQGTNPAALEAKLPDFLQRHGAVQLEQLGMKKSLHLQPIASIHTTPGLTADQATNTSSRFLNMLLLIAGFIQMVACINFMNLTTARSTKRAQEVGVRKAVGAPRISLIGQFLSESLLLTAISMLMAIPLVGLLMPFLNNLTGASIEIAFTKNLQGIGLVGALVVLTGLVAGSYPAFYLSSFRPLAVLRGTSGLKGNAGATWLRKGLVVSQFAISSALVIGALIVHFQLDYMLEKDLGFEKKQKVVFPFRTTESHAAVATFRNEIMRLPEVGSASAMAVCPGQMVYNDLPLYKPGQDMNSATAVRFTYCDENYLNTLKIKLLAGRQFTQADTSTQEGTAKAIVSEAVLNHLGIPLEAAPGMVLSSDFEDQRIKITVVGVMQDYLYQNLGSEMDPFMVIYEQPNRLAHVIADVNTADFPSFFKKTEATWKSVLPSLPFEYSFLDENLAQLYSSEQNLSRIISAFTFGSHLDFLPRSLWPRHLHGRAAHERNRYSKSARSNDGRACWPDVKGLFETCAAGISYCFPVGLFFHEKMAARFRLSH
ncbi:MAG: ABC transporter permease [Saprospiraceae bacterium]|nr:ABC transporter permease [Saprospiraceae bacterium]